MLDHLRFWFNRLGERLWVKPLGMCFLSIGAALMAGGADHLVVPEILPDISTDTISTLLQIMASSMLVIATFAVGSMVSSYASASGTATPRAFSVVIADDVSQNALSSFIGAFIFSIVGIIALMNGFFGASGRFALFAMTLVVFSVVVLMFVRWVDKIARLGRLGTTIDQVESATAAALRQRRRAMSLGGVPAGPLPEERQVIQGRTVGHVQRVDVPKLQRVAEQSQCRIVVAAVPGTFSDPSRPLAYVTAQSKDSPEVEPEQVRSAFVIGHDRTFDEDPRFGLIVLSEIAGRALSPAVNDPGTAIDIVKTFLRLFVLWNESVNEDEKRPCDCDRVEVPELSIRDMFDDAFAAIARDGAGVVEVGIRLLKALNALAELGDEQTQEAVRHHSRMVLVRAEAASMIPEDLEILRSIANIR